MNWYTSLELSFLSLESGRTVNGEKVRRFRKTLIRAGRFVKQLQDQEDQEIVVTRDRLNKWAVDFHRMRSSGIKVPIPNSHDEAGDAEKNHGYVEDIFVENDDLVMICEIKGEKSIEAASKGDVSIRTKPGFKDGNGVVYDEPIVHVAMCTDPVVPDLGDFVSIVASRKESKNMKWETIQKALGIKGEMTDDTANDLVTSHMEELSKKTETITASRDDAVKKFDILKASVKDKPKFEPDPMMLELCRESRTAKLAALVSASKITPAVSDSLTKLYVDEAALTLSLSRGKEGLIEFDGVVEALAKNDIVELGERTGPQVNKDTLVLSSALQGSDKNPLVAGAIARGKTVDFHAGMSRDFG